MTGLFYSLLLFMASASVTPLEFTQKENVAINQTISKYSNMENECKPMQATKRNATSVMLRTKCLENGKEYEAIIGVDFENQIRLRLRK